MRLHKLLWMLFLIIAGNCVIASTNPKRPWTFITYIAADNNLNPEADANIAQMVKASNSNNVYILVYLNIKRAGEPKKTQRLIIQNGTIHQDGATTVEDSGDANTLIKALSWAVTQFPCDHLLVDIWNHGDGPLNRSMMPHRGVCYDDTTGNYMTDLEYKRALDVIVNQYMHGKKIDIIAFDACLMADVEVAFTIANYADCLVSSQQTVPGPGFNYTDVLSIFAHETPDALTLAKWLATSYNSYYKNSGESYTLSAVDLNKLNSLVSATNALAQALNTLLQTAKAKKLKNIIQTCSSPRLCPHFDEPTYLDLYTFCANLVQRIPQLGLPAAQLNTLKSVLANTMNAITQCVVANVHSMGLAKVHGLSIYFTDRYGIEPSYNALYWTSVNPQWQQFLASYLKSF